MANVRVHWYTGAAQDQSGEALNMTTEPSMGSELFSTPGYSSVAPIGALFCMVEIDGPIRYVVMEDAATDTANATSQPLPATVGGYTEPIACKAGHKIHAIDI